MTTKKQIRDLLKPFMVNNPDIVISGQLAFLTPIRHVISGIEFQRGLTKDYCHVTPGLFNALYSPLYERLTSGSMAAAQVALAMFVTPFALAMLSA